MCPEALTLYSGMFQASGSLGMTPEMHVGFKGLIKEAAGSCGGLYSCRGLCM